MTRRSVFSMKGTSFRLLLSDDEQQTLARER